MEQRIRNSFGRQRERFALKHFEENFNLRHQNWIEQRIEEKRNYAFDIDESYQIAEKNTNSTIEELNNRVSYINMKVDNINCVNLEIIHNFLEFIRQNIYTDKTKTKNQLKLLRKEISKDFLQVDILSLLLNHEKSLLMILADFLFDFKNSEIQIETIWILNNLCIFCHRYGFKDYFYQIHKILVIFMQSENCFSNAGVKNLILEKFFSLVGNLILYEENVYHYYINSNLLVYLIKNLNSSVRSMRAVCLWNINTIISVVNNCDENNITAESTKKMISEILFNNKGIIYYLKFLLVRTDPTKNFDECYEFLWLLNYIQIRNPDLFISFLMRDGENSFLNNLRKILDYMIINKLHQPILRIFGNLLGMKSNLYYDYNQITQMILNDKNVIIFLSGILKNNSFIYNQRIGFNHLNINLNNNENSYLIKDVVWFIKNLNFNDKNNFVENYFIYDLINLLYNLNNIGIDNNIIDEVVQNIFVVIYSILVNENAPFNQEIYKIYSFLIETIYKMIDMLYNFRLIIIDLIVNFVIYKNNKVIPIDLSNHIEFIEKKNTSISEDEYKYLTNELKQFLI